MIRELHVYGQVKKVSEKRTDTDVFGTAQHVGFGRRLVEKAIEISRENNYNKISVISGIGVKNYYRKFGFEDEEYFMTMSIPKIENSIETNQIIKKMRNTRNIRFHNHIDDMFEQGNTVTLHVHIAMLILIFGIGIIYMFL